MIDVKFTRDDKIIALKLTGHAGAADEGYDIYCASASVLAYTVAQMAQIMHQHGELRKTPTIKLEKGDAEVVIKPKKAHYQEALHTFFVAQVGYALLAHNFPEYIRLEPYD